MIDIEKSDLRACMMRFWPRRQSADKGHTKPSSISLLRRRGGWQPSQKAAIQCQLVPFAPQIEYNRFSRASYTESFSVHAARPGHVTPGWLDDLAGDVGQPEVAALEAVDQSEMVDAEQGEDRGVQVVDVDDVVHGGIAEFVGRAVGDSRP